MYNGERALLDEEEKEKRVKLEGIKSAEELEAYMNEYDYPPDALLSLAAADVKPETMVRFWLRLDQVHLRSTGRHLRLCSVMAASKTGLPHIHGVPQRPQDVDMELLERYCKASGYSIMLTNSMEEEPGRDARNYVAGHLKRTGFRIVPPKVIMGEGIQTSRKKSQVDRRLRREQRKETRRRRAAAKRAAKDASASRASAGSLVQREDDQRQSNALGRRQVADGKYGAASEWLAQNDVPKRKLYVTKVGAVKPLFPRAPREIRIETTTIRRRRLG